MREIKFRAYNKASGNIYPVLEIWFAKNNVHPHGPIGALLDIGNDKTVFCEFDVIVLMQFTGLKDKNGKEFYEGDILRGYNNCGRVVEWEGIGWNPFEDDVIDAEDSIRYEIIGNIHQHQNLLEQDNARP